MEDTELDNFPLVDTDVERPSIVRLTLDENRESEGVLNPSNTLGPQSRIGNEGFRKFRQTILRSDKISGTTLRSL